MSETIQVRIEKLIYGGQGLARHGGQTVFTPFVLPGETVNVRPTERRKHFMRAGLEEVTEAAPERIMPECPHFGICGGCHYQHIEYKEQVRFKAEILRETLARIGKIGWDGPIGTLGSPAYGYRNRAQWKTGTAGDGLRAVGYFEAGSRTLCPVRVCPILSPRLQETLGVFLKLGEQRLLPPGLQEIEAFADDRDDKLLLNLGFAEQGPEAHALLERLKAELPCCDSILAHFARVDRFQLEGPGYIRYSVANHNYRVGHLSFFQVNRFLIPELVKLVVQEARGRLALDLYAGAGLFAVPLAQRYERLIAVESNAATARDLEANLQDSGGASPAAKQSDVSAFLARWRESPDLVLLDPPRSGVAAQALQRLLKLKPAVIGYVSCDPATLARDLAVLAGNREKAGRYMLDSVYLVDMFPQSYHLEAFVRLIRRE